MLCTLSVPAQHFHLIASNNKNGNESNTAESQECQCDVNLGPGAALPSNSLQEREQLTARGVSAVYTLGPGAGFLFDRLQEAKGKGGRETSMKEGRRERQAEEEE